MTDAPSTPETPEFEMILARVCHEANRAWCEAHGDLSQPIWAEAEPWMVEASKSTVRYLLDHPDAPDSAIHDQWMAQKRADGWVHGPVKDAEKKTHPCLAPFEALPKEQQAKDRLMRAVVAALAPLADAR